MNPASTTGLRCSVIVILVCRVVVCRVVVCGLRLCGRARQRRSLRRSHARHLRVRCLSSRSAPSPVCSRRTYRERPWTVDARTTRQADTDVNSGERLFLTSWSTHPLDTMVRSHLVRNRLGTAITDPTGRTVTFSPLHMRRHRCATRRDTDARRQPACTDSAPPLARSRRRHRAPPASVAAGGRAAGRRGQLGPGARQRLPRPEHPRSGAASTTASPRRTSPPPGQTINIQVSTSPRRGQLDARRGVDALPHAPLVGRRWATPGRPSVVHDSTDNDFVMYYTATETSTGDQCIGVATSPSAHRPLHRHQHAARRLPERRRLRRRPPSTTANCGGSIDPDVFTDNAGNSWLLWKSDGNHMARPRAPSSGRCH